VDFSKRTTYNFGNIIKTPSTGAALRFDLGQRERSIYLSIIKKEDKDGAERTEYGTVLRKGNCH
jgi:hypothetical protein